MFKPGAKSIALIEDIERRIDPEVEEDFLAQWRSFLFGGFKGELFSPIRKKLSAPTEEPVRIHINDAIEDYDMMLQMQLSQVSASLNSKNRCLCLRANYGTGIMSSVLGAEMFMMPRNMSTLPTTKACNDPEWIRAMVERGVPDLRTSLGKKVFEFSEECAELFAKYPKFSKYVTMYHPDLQGPLDVCELLWGGEMFYSMYDEPELVHGALSLITETYTRFMNEWHKLFPASEEMNPHWESFYHRGKLVLRSDSAMNISPDLYREYSLPYDKLLLERFGGGIVHFCGRGDHYIDILCQLPELYGINMSQPEYNDMEKIYKNTVDKGIKIFAFQKKQAEDDIGRAGGFHGNVHV
ncbi:MAG: hypothetical protein IJY39_02905 [Clostridia bacterium]|nr:hypothetical protein [Clostridia bacterium]